MQDLKTGLFLADNDQTRRVLPQTSADIVEILSSAGEASNVQAEISSLRAAKLATPAVGGTTGQVLSLDESGNTVWKADEKGDTLPNISSATAGQVLKVNSAVNGTEWGDAPKELPEQLGTSGQVLTVNSAASGVEWKTPESGLPAIGSASAGDVLAVNSTANGVEWKKNTIVKKIDGYKTAFDNTTPLTNTDFLGNANKWSVKFTNGSEISTIPDHEKIVAINAFSIRSTSNTITKMTQRVVLNENSTNNNTRSVSVFFEENSVPTNVINVYVAIYYTD